MPNLTFPRKQLADMVASASSRKVKELLLVGDDGVYFCDTSTSPRPCVYAQGCNPNAGDDWYDLKTQTFGGSDGVEAFPVHAISRWINDNKRRSTVVLKITPDKIHLLAPSRAP